MRCIVGVPKFPGKLSCARHNTIRRSHGSQISQETCAPGAMEFLAADLRAAWRNSVCQRPLGDATFGGSEQSLKFFRGQLAESAAG